MKGSRKQTWQFSFASPPPPGDSIFCFDKGPSGAYGKVGGKISKSEEDDSSPWPKFPPPSSTHIFTTVIYPVNFATRVGLHCRHLENGGEDGKTFRIIVVSPSSPPPPFFEFSYSLFVCLSRRCWAFCHTAGGYAPILTVKERLRRWLFFFFSRGHP